MVAKLFVLIDALRRPEPTPKRRYAESVRCPFCDSTESRLKYGAYLIEFRVCEKCKREFEVRQ